MTDTVEKAPVPRKEDGTFPKGVSGNPAGRPKGSKNAITLLRQELELHLRERASGAMGAVLDKAIEMAMEGHPGMIKLLLELHMTKGSPEEKAMQEKVSIIINADKTPTTAIEADEADYEEIDNG